MAIRISLRVQGLKEMDQKLKQLGPDISRKLVGNALKKAAEIPLAQAKVTVNVKSGALRDSLTSQQLPMKGGDFKRAVIIGGRKPVGTRTHWLEFGTYIAAPFPFLRPALDSTAQVTVVRFGQILGGGIKQMLSRMGRL